MPWREQLPERCAEWLYVPSRHFAVALSAPLGLVFRPDGARGAAAGREAGALGTGQAPAVVVIVTPLQAALLALPAFEQS